MVEGIALVVLGTAFIVQSVLHSKERTQAAEERERLSRMAFAESKSERIAAALPERTPRQSPPVEQRPVKPLGL